MRPVGKTQSAFRCPLNRILGTEANVRVLRTLANSEPSLTGREVADTAGLSMRGATTSLTRLDEAGIVAVDGARRARRYRIRDQHPLSSALRELFEAEQQRVERIWRGLREVISSAEPSALSAWIDGPVAQQLDALNEPLRLCVLTRTTAVDALRTELAEALTILERESDMMIELRVVTRADLATGMSRFDSDSIKLVFGPPPETLTSRASPKGGTPGRQQRTHREADAELRWLGAELARLVRQDPSLLRTAAKRLRNQLVHEARPATDVIEWLRVLETNSAWQIAKLLESDSERATRLRQSPVLLAALPAQQRARIAHRRRQDESRST